ncbi:lytic transglycosylase domain-containing protein [Spiractinospora alimapuensis]|uniref:lytic transglycosylase domain-containing protein n=1 Tax=Spiractinospora alimapuensis TaxID=2820884 RepID=UPI001F28D4DF|nr:lytic transglycosylase domain-containing protein [Spiractinospora alimapuensis]
MTKRADVTPESDTPTAAPVSWKTAVGAVAVTVAVAGGVVALVAGTMDSAVTPPTPPGALEAAGSVSTMPDEDQSSAAVAEPTADDEPTEDSEPEPEETDEEPEVEDEGDDAEPPPMEADPVWLDDVADRTDIPRRALEGYANAQLLLAEENPSCQVSWPTLAGIGWVESRHGTYAGGEIGPDGNTTVDVIGVPLNGGPGVARIPDSNDGEMDGDTEWDRAVGPMQFIPTTWEQWGTSADAKGQPDPHNIDDAAFSAARYLCAQGRDLTDDDDWWEAIISYNRSESYARDVLDTANEYVTAAED